MPEPVELILKADNSQYVSKIREAQKATQNLYNTVEKEDIRQKGLIEQQIDRLERLKEVKKKSYDPNDIAIYNNAIADANKKLKEYDQLGVKANEDIKKSTDGLTEAFGGLVKKLGIVTLAIAGITKVAKSIAEAFKDTVLGLNAISVAGEVWKTMAYNIATATLNMSKFNITMANSLATGKLINEQRKQDRNDLIISSQLREDYNKLYFESADRTKSLSYQLTKLTEAERVHNEMIDIELENAQRQLVIIESQLISRPKSNKLLDEEAKLLAKINMIEGQRYSEIKRVEMRRSSIENQIREEDMKKYTDWIEAKLKAQDEFQALSLKLLDDYEKTQIDLLEGNDKIRAQRDYGLKQLEEMRKQMEKLGKLSKEQEKQFAILGAGIWVAFYEGLTEEAQKKLPQKDIDAISKVLLPQLQGLVKKDIPAEMAKIKSWVNSNKEFSIWNILGLDPNNDDDKEAIEAVKNAADKMQDIFQEILDKRVEMAQRERELLDTRISETQHEIELEAELMQAGFANNLSARQQYLEQLKKQRDQALADEDKAIKQQLIAQKLIQTTNILSGVSEIIKTSAKYPVIGMILAAASIASLFAIWSQSKSKATKLEEGGSGTVTGKRHSQGGERFLDHVEIEQGERWGVLSRRASDKYGNIFEDMVSSFNRDQMPDFITPTVSNNIRVENSGPNQRLDRVIKEQEKMNTQLKQGQLYVAGTKRIIKSGNKTRIIG